MGILQQVGAGIAAVEAHEGFRQAVIVLALDALVIHRGRHGVVDVQQGHGRAGHADADVLGQHAVDVHFAGNRDAHAGQTAVDIAGHELELGLEGRPALVGKGHVLTGALVLLSPIQQGQLILSQPGQNARVGIVAAQFFFHFLHLGGDAGIVGMLVVGRQQIQLGIFFHGHAQIVQRLDGRVAGQEVIGTGTEGDHLQALQAQNGAVDG